MSSPSTWTVEGQDAVPLHVVEWPGPEGEPKGVVLVVHGFREHSGRYAEVARILAAHGLRVFGYDHRGHGRSGGRRGVLPSFDVFVRDLATVRTEVAKRAGEPPRIYGHSMGALVVLRYLQTSGEPVQAAVLSAPWLGTAVRIPAWKRLLAHVLRVVLPDLTLSAPPNPQALTRDPALQEAYRNDPLVHERMSAGFFHRVRAAQRAASVGTLPATGRLLVLVPTGDRVAAVEDTRRWLASLPPRRVESWTLPGVLHEPHNDLGGEAVVTRVAEWLLDRQAADDVEWRSA